MQKIKKYRSADSVIGGFRYGENLVAGQKVVGSLLLGLYDDDGLLHHVDSRPASRQGKRRRLPRSLKSRGRSEASPVMHRVVQPMVDEAVFGVGFDQTEICGRSVIRLTLPVGGFGTGPPS